MIAGRETAVGEQEAITPLAAQSVDHRNDRVAHIVRDRAATEGEAAEHRRGPVPRPAEAAPCHLGAARNAAVKLDAIENVGGNLLPFARARDLGFHADYFVVYVAVCDTCGFSFQSGRESGRE